MGEICSCIQLYKLHTHFHIIPVTTQIQIPSLQTPPPHQPSDCFPRRLTFSFSDGRTRTVSRGRGRWCRRSPHPPLHSRHLGTDTHNTASSESDTHNAQARWMITILLRDLNSLTVPQSNRMFRLSSKLWHAVEICKIMPQDIYSSTFFRKISPPLPVFFDEHYILMHIYRFLFKIDINSIQNQCQVSKIFMI